MEVDMVTLSKKSDVGFIWVVGINQNHCLFETNRVEYVVKLVRVVLSLSPLITLPNLLALDLQKHFIVFFGCHIYIYIFYTLSVRKTISRSQNIEILKISK